MLKKGAFFQKNRQKSEKRAQNKLHKGWVYGKIERLKIHTRSLCVIRVRKIFQCGRHYEPTQGGEEKRRFELWQLLL